jgi:hypothetical protein
MNGQRYLGNINKTEVHDLDNEKIGPRECQIDEIIRAGHDRPFDTQAAANNAGHDNCAYCIGNSRR